MTADNEGATTTKALIIPDDGRPLASVEPPSTSITRIIALNLLQSDYAIPERFTKEREDFLREAGLNTDIVADAITIVCQKISSLSFVVTGPESTATEWRDILVRFWTTEVQSFVRELCWSNKGAYSQVVRWAPPWAVDNEGVLTERGRDAIADGTADSWEVAFVQALDSRRCIPQADLVEPLIYSPSKGQLLPLRETQFLHVIDSPIADPAHSGQGQCAVDRCIEKALERQEIVKYFREAFSDKPRAGLVTLNNLHQADFDEAINILKTGQSKKGMTNYQGMIFLTNAEITAPIGVQSIPFRIAPDGWDQRNTYEETVQIVATSFGLDTLEFGIISGAGLGTAAQSTVMHKKSRGKFVSLIMEGLEREIKLKLLPDNVGFEFVSQDVEEELEQAELKGQQIGNVRQMWEADGTGAGIITVEQAQQLLVDYGVLPKELVTVDLTDREEIEETEPTSAEKMVKAHSDGSVVAIYVPPILLASKSYAVKQRLSSRHPRRNVRSNNEYINELRSIYDTWAVEATSALEEAEIDEREMLLVALFALLASRLKAAGQQGLRDAFDLGLQGEIPDAESLEALDAAIAENDAFIATSLIPDARARFDKEASTPGFAWNEEMLLPATSALAWRTWLYGGVHWEMIGLGVGVGILRRGNPVVRYLDPAADHCATCPPKAREYPSWGAMVAASGIPGDGTDECDGGCKCGVDEIRDGVEVPRL